MLRDCPWQRLDGCSAGKLGLGDTDPRSETGEERTQIGHPREGGVPQIAQVGADRFTAQHRFGKRADHMDAEPVHGGVRGCACPVALTRQGGKEAAGGVGGRKNADWQGRAVGGVCPSDADLRRGHQNGSRMVPEGLDRRAERTSGYADGLPPWMQDGLPQVTCGGVDLGLIVQSDRVDACVAQGGNELADSAGLPLRRFGELLFGKGGVAFRDALADLCVLLLVTQGREARCQDACGFACMPSCQFAQPDEVRFGVGEVPLSCELVLLAGEPCLLCLPVLLPGGTYC